MGLQRWVYPQTKAISHSISDIVFVDMLPINIRPHVFTTRTVQLQMMRLGIVLWDCIHTDGAARV